MRARMLAPSPDACAAASACGVCADRNGQADARVRRRQVLAGLAHLPLTAAALSFPLTLQAQGGAGQIEEPLADSVRTALSAAVAGGPPMRPDFADSAARVRFLRWMGDMSARLRPYKPEPIVREDFLETVWYESTRAGLDRALVLGVIQVESAFRKYAISSAGARGYMQVMPFWARLIGDGDAGKLFHLQTNLRFGCVILRHYLDIERGNLFMALGRYNGSRGRAVYPDAVFAARRRWMWGDPES